MKVIKDPPIKKHKGRGRPGIDWEELKYRWCAQEEHNNVHGFLAQYGIILARCHPRIRSVVNSWPIKPGQEQIAEIMSVSVPDRESKRYEDNVARVWEMIRSCRATQAEKDYRTGEKIRAIIELNIRQLEAMEEAGKEIKGHQIVNLAKSLETVQRIQRLSLGMSTDNVGVEDARKLAEDQAADGEMASDAPVFAVEVTDNGKFKRLRPRRVN